MTEKEFPVKVILDIVSIPEELTVEQVKKISDNHNIVLWDSSRGGRRPIVLDEDSNIEIKDLNDDRRI